MDNNTLNLVGRKKFNIPQEAIAMLLVEFDQEPIEERIEEVKKLSEKYQLCEEIAVAHSKEEQDILWKARKAI